uniref:Uncharacterized protein n=1 Tax=Rhizophora mucronata TaxID=61149 RepID=A0A2P2K1U4_RHIMU
MGILCHGTYTIYTTFVSYLAQLQNWCQGSTMLLIFTIFITITTITIHIRFTSCGFSRHQFTPFTRNIGHFKDSNRVPRIFLCLSTSNKIHCVWKLCAYQTQ